VKRLVVLLAAALALGAVLYVVVRIALDEDEPLPTPEVAPYEAGRRPGRDEPEFELPEGAGPRAGAAAPPYPWEPPDWKRTMVETLDRTNVDIDVEKVLLVDLLEELRHSLPYPVELDRGAVVKRRIDFTYRVKGIRASALISSVVRRSGLVLYYTPGRLHLAAPGREPTPTGAEGVLRGLEVARKLLSDGGPIRPPLEKLLPIRYEKTTVWRAAAKVAARLDVPVEVVAEIDADIRNARLTLETDRLTVARVLDEIAGGVGLSWGVEDHRIVICEADRAHDLRDRAVRAEALRGTEVHLNYRSRPLHEVVRDLGKQIDAPVYVDRALWEPDHPRVTLEIHAAPLRKALIALGGAVAARHLVRADAVYLVAR
jgi:hypothetical protein